MRTERGEPVYEYLEITANPPGVGALPELRECMCDSAKEI